MLNLSYLRHNREFNLQLVGLCEIWLSKHDLNQRLGVENPLNYSFVSLLVSAANHNLRITSSFVKIKNQKTAAIVSRSFVVIQLQVLLNY
jgi:hypothetical protein